MSALIKCLKFLDTNFRSFFKFLVDLSTLDNRILIRDAVQNGRIQESIHLVNQLHPELLDNDRYLYFHLQQLHLIELIR